jgi:hypothetical protein
MKVAVFLSLLLPAFTVGKAYKVRAQWTGNIKFITTVSGKPGVECEYIYGGNTFWQTFANRSTCPSFVEVD